MKKDDKIWIDYNSFIYPGLFIKQDGKIAYVYRYALGLWNILELNIEYVTLRTQNISYDIFTNRGNYLK